uniref:Uncharacterized protein n=1 Tax=Rhizophora mucronata TaxID=61149 RepID=A0A2P2QYT5_RHIMU
MCSQLREEPNCLRLPCRLVRILFMRSAMNFTSLAQSAFMPGSLRILETRNIP